MKIFFKRLIIEGNLQAV